jgi:hypothetical protein
MLAGRAADQLIDLIDVRPGKPDHLTAIADADNYPAALAVGKGHHFCSQGIRAMHIRLELKPAVLTAGNQLSQIG